MCQHGQIHTRTLLRLLQYKQLMLTTRTTKLALKSPHKERTHTVCCHPGFLPQLTQQAEQHPTTRHTPVQLTFTQVTTDVSAESLNIILQKYIFKNVCESCRLKAGTRAESVRNFLVHWMNFDHMFLPTPPMTGIGLSKNGTWVMHVKPQRTAVIHYVCAHVAVRYTMYTCIHILCC